LQHVSITPFPAVSSRRGKSRYSAGLRQTTPQHARLLGISPVANPESKRREGQTFASWDEVDADADELGSPLPGASR
jgi:hypothetical protein